MQTNINTQNDQHSKRAKKLIWSHLYVPHGIEKSTPISVLSI